MTAEIAVLNKSAIALAADSAVTIQHRDGQKIYNTANKLFAFSSRCPVGIMIYGSAELMGIPWETIIRVYQDHVGNKKFNRLQDYAKHFFSFLDRKNSLFPQSEQDKNFKRTVSACFREIRNEIDETVNKAIEKHGNISKSKIKEIANEIPKSYFDLWNKAKTLKNFPKTHRTNLRKKYSNAVPPSKDILELPANFKESVERMTPKKK